MAHFHFHICDEHGAVPDEEGGDFSSIGDALKQAQRSAVRLVAHGPSSRAAHKRIEITNAAGDVVSVAGLRDAVH
jgi:hypothetical protein